MDDTILKIRGHFPYLVPSEFDKLSWAAATDMPVLITGSSGSGKSFLAALIHEASGRSGEMRLLNLSGLSDSLFESEIFGHVKGAFTGALNDRVGLFEACNKGTVILEEVSELRPESQITLLDFLETKKIRKIGQNAEQELDVRIIATTNKAINPQEANGSFRQDLYFRLSRGFEIALPDLNGLPITFLRNIIIKEVINCRRNYETPNSTISKLSVSDGLINYVKEKLQGNYRGIQKLALHLAFSKTNNFCIKHVPYQLNGAPAKPRLKLKPLKEMKADYIKQVLEACHGSQTKAAKILGVTTRTIRNVVDE